MADETCTCKSAVGLHASWCPLSWPPPERVWVLEVCRMDCIDREWVQEKPSNLEADKAWLRGCEYVRVDVHDARVAELQARIADLEMALR
jgi:hypothetical protein